MHVISGDPMGISQGFENLLLMTSTVYSTDNQTANNLNVNCHRESPALALTSSLEEFR